jgi:methylated-DNA-[protein]-cysteine S-methyltransferase
MTYEAATIETPLGTAHALARDGRLCALELAAMAPRATSTRAWRRRPDARTVADPAGVASALAAYFAGDLAAVDAIDVDPDGTPFQRLVWAALRTIPAGTTATYGEIARAIRAPTASRAVGAANGANPIWLVVPCHRVIGASGALTGYAAGIEVKRRLLAHEATHRGGRAGAQSALL